MSVIYVAKAGYGKYNIAEATVIKETPKQFQIERTLKNIHGSMYLPRRINTSDHNIFRTLLEAREWCLDKVKEYVDSQIEDARRAQMIVEQLESLIADEGGL